MTLPSEIREYIVGANRKKDYCGDEVEDPTDAVVNFNAKPNNQCTKESCKENVTRTGESRDGKSLAVRPTIQSRSRDERKPVSW